jgi:hypothetical protein
MEFDEKDSNYGPFWKPYITGVPEAVRVKCPYGMPGDRLWVRETFWTDGDEVIYRSDPGAEKELDSAFTGLNWKPSIHMPRWASRINLEVTGVRVERLCSISEADALAEGCCPFSDDFGSYHARVAFCQLWESIYGPESWDANPWVWVVEFCIDEQNAVTHHNAT